MQDYVFSLITVIGLLGVFLIVTYILGFWAGVFWERNRRENEK